MTHVAVIDIGKTNAKVALVDLHRRAEIAVRTRPNTVRRDGPYPHFDTDGLWQFILGSLAFLHAERRIDAISVTTHGATAALLDGGGNLALPVLDYEHAGPDDTAAAYDAARPAFAETGSPRLPLGLNLGAQLFWQSRTFPQAFSRVASIVTYPQYWAHRLSGVLAGEVTSLGCHTDLWNPSGRDYSSLVDAIAWRELFPPLHDARTVLGPILPEVAGAAGLNPDTPVVCGIHDSNASLLPHLLDRMSPFSVVSTGTWVISMAIGGQPKKLDPARDTLINVNALGDPVPSARFMGGREFELVVGKDLPACHEDDVEGVLSSLTMLLPSTVKGSGPFAAREANWINGEPQGAQRFVAASFYLALMTAQCLGLIGAEDEIVVEGPFAANALYLSMLAAATRRPVVTREEQKTGTSIGAALLVSSTERGSLRETVLLADRPALLRYAGLWRSHLSGL